MALFWPPPRPGGKGSGGREGEERQGEERKENMAKYGFRSFCRSAPPRSRSPVGRLVRGSKLFGNLLASRLGARHSAIDQPLGLAQQVRACWSAPPADMGNRCHTTAAALIIIVIAIISLAKAHQVAISARFEPARAGHCLMSPSAVGLAARNMLQATWPRRLERAATCRCRRRQQCADA